ncbi:outer membrane adhesin like protein [Mycolicibacterium rhodesiae JS60]|nr:outer membrane adhesin like protein [Mycolicibacterium rhodesiae JS60]
MAAAGRKPRRTNGRHRKPSAFESSNCAQWLRVGTVGVGLGAAIVGSQAVASAAPDDSPHSANPGAGTGTAGPRSPATRAGQTEPSKHNTDGASRSSTTSSHKPATPATPGKRSAAGVAADDRLPTVGSERVVSSVNLSAPSAVPTTAALRVGSTTEIGRAPTSYISALDDALDAMGHGGLGSPVRGPTLPGGAPEGLWLAAGRNHEERNGRRLATARAEYPPGAQPWDAVQAAFANGTHLFSDLSELVTRVVHHVGAGIDHEIANATKDFERAIRLSVAPAAASLHAFFSPESGAAPTAAASATPTAAATPAAGTGAWYFIGTLQRAINRLAGWPGLPHDFVTITNHLTDQSLDALDDQLDTIYATAPVGSPARWLPDLVSILNLFVESAIPSYTISDTLNAWGDFLNRIVPPFTISPGAGTFGVITQYKIMGAAVVGTATVLTDMLNGVYDPAQWEIDVIKATTGATVTRADLTNSTSLETKIAAAQAAAILTLGLSDGGAFYEPERAWNITLPTWTAAQVNPFTVVTYVVLVAMYKRFQEIAVLTTFTTSTTYDSWLYTLSLGGDSTRSEYAAGTFHAVDPDGRSVDFGTSLLGTYTSAGGGLVTINTSDGGFTYTNTLPGKAFFHRATSENEADRYDTVNIPVTSADGVEYTLTFTIQIIDGSNANPASSPTMSAADGLGVVRGSVGGSDSDGDTLTYSLVGSSVNGLNNNSGYTKNGAGNGGIVTLNPTTGAFTYVSSATAGATQSFQVQMTDGHGGTTIATVTVPNTTSITPGNLNTSTPYVVTGSVPVPSGDAGLFTSYALGASPTKGTVTSFNPITGEFTYTSSVGRTTANSDVVTVIATDASGRTVTLKLAVTPAVVNSAPTPGATTIDTSNLQDNRILGIGTLRQTTTGTLHASDADSDPLSYTAGTFSTVNGGSVVVNADGTFTYAIDKGYSYYHAAAEIGATGNAVGDSFTATVSDPFGSATTYTVVVPIYAANTVPSLSSGVRWPGSNFLNTYTYWTSVNGSDSDSDSMTYAITAQPVHGSASYDSFLNVLSTSGTQTSDTIILTVYDGYYVVNNGVVNSTPASYSLPFTAQQNF